MKRIAPQIVLGCLLVGAVWPAAAILIRPAIDGVVRDGTDSPKDGAPDQILDNTVVQVLNVDRPVEPFEDRGVIEFLLPAFSNPISNASLTLPVFGANGPYPFRIDVFGYGGDGALALGDFNAGVLVRSFNYAGQSSVGLNVTSFLRELDALDADYAGFNFRYSIPSTIPGNGPFVAFNSREIPGRAGPAILNVTTSPLAIPEPAALMLMAVGLTMMGWGWKRRA